MFLAKNFQRIKQMLVLKKCFFNKFTFFVLSNGYFRSLVHNYIVSFFSLTVRPFGEVSLYHSFRLTYVCEIWLMETVARSPTYVFVFVCLRDSEEQKVMQILFTLPFGSSLSLCMYAYCMCVCLIVSSPQHFF